jgi:hypothetical protein
MDPATILFGLGVGLLVGITGMGGGSLMAAEQGRARAARVRAGGRPVVLAVVVFIVLRRRSPVGVPS